MPIDRLEEQPGVGLEEQRLAAFTEAASLMFSDVVTGGAEAIEFGPPEISAERIRALEVIRKWAKLEIEWIQQEAKRDQPWDILYVSTPNREDQVWATLASEEEAKRWVRAKEGGALFGYFKIRQRSLLD